MQPGLGAVWVDLESPKVPADMDRVAENRGRVDGPRVVHDRHHPDPGLAGHVVGLQVVCEVRGDVLVRAVVNVGGHDVGE